MLDISRPDITRFIAHIVDLETDTMVPSDLETPVHSKSGFPKDFFDGYVRHALTDPKKRFACFRDGSLVKSAFEDFNKGRISFVQASRKIADHLDSVIQDSRYSDRIKKGDLMVGLFEDSEAKNKTKYLALLKINPSSAVVRRSKGPKGSRTVVFETDQRVPAPAEDEVQKIALISSSRLSHSEQFDVVLIDYNLRRKSVAHFFFDDFLQSSLNSDPESTAENLLGGVYEAPDILEAELQLSLSPIERRAIRSKGEEALKKNAAITPKLLAQEALKELKRPPDVVLHAKEKMAAFLKNLPEEKVAEDQQLAISTQQVAKRALKKKYILDGGVQISGTTEALDSLLNVADELDELGRTCLTICTKIFQVQWTS